MSDETSTENQGTAPQEGETQVSGSQLDASKEGGSKSLLSGTEIAEGEWMLTENIKGVGDKPEHYDSQHFKNLSEQAKGYSELHKKFGAFTGSPKDGYKAPEGLDQEDELYSNYVEFASGLKMNQEGFDKGLELYLAQAEAGQEIKQEAELAKLGDNASQRIMAVENMLKDKMGDQFVNVQNLVNTAGSVKLVEEIFKAFTPKKLPIDGGISETGLTWEKIEAEMFKKHDNGQLLRSVDQGHESKIQQMMKEFGG